MKYAIKKKIMAGLILPPLMFTCGVSLGKNVFASSHHNTMPTRFREELVNNIYIALTNLQNEFDRTQSYIDEREEDWNTVEQTNVQRGKIVDPANAAVNFNGTFNDGTIQKDWQNNCDDPLSQAYNGYEYLVGDQPVEDWALGGKARKAVVKNRYYFPNNRLKEAPGVIDDVTKKLKEYNNSLYGNNGQ